MASLCNPWFTTTNLSYTFPIFETSATTLRYYWYMLQHTDVEGFTSVRADFSHSRESRVWTSMNHMPAMLMFTRIHETSHQHPSFHKPVLFYCFQAAVAPHWSAPGFCRSVVASSSKGMTADKDQQGYVSDSFWLSHGWSKAFPPHHFEIYLYYKWSLVVLCGKWNFIIMKKTCE